MSSGHTIAIAVETFAAGDLTGAESLCRELVTREPGNTTALHILGLVAHRDGRSNEGSEMLLRCIALQPDVADFHNTLATIRLGLGRAGDAEEACREAVRLRPDYPEAHANLAIALQRLGRLSEAETACRRAIELRPGYRSAYLTLAEALHRQGRIGEAIEALRQVPEGSDRIVPGRLAYLLAEAGRIREAVECSRRAVTLELGNPALHSNLAYTLHYLPQITPAQLFAEHAAWGKRHADRLSPKTPPAFEGPSSSRRLRIGYVAPDLARHPVRFLFHDLLAHHDRNRFEVSCFADGAGKDESIRAWSSSVDHWHPIGPMDDAAAADFIRRQGIDVMVDLIGHAGRHRLGVFARAPAPVQVNYLGYPNTSGMASMDYRLIDPLIDPPGHTEQYNTETLLRVPGCLSCYNPLTACPDPGPVPALSCNGVTFACLNNPCKVTPEMIGLWFRIIAAVPNSRLMALYNGNDDDRADAAARFTAAGFPPDRLHLVRRTATRAEYLALYRQVDVALDPFPYNGHTTTLDGFWMGVPVITLRGQTTVSRYGTMLLHAVGLDDLATTTADDYADSAVRLAADLPRLKDLRSTLRGRIESSPLMDARLVIREIEAAFEHAYREKCAASQI